LEIAMTRWFTVFALALLLLVGCSTSNHSAEPVPVDPATDPTIVGTVDEAVLEGSIEAEEAARTGRRIGRVAGVLAAVFGGPQRESIDDTIDRYRRTRDAIVVTSTLIGATKGAVEGAQRGHELDLQFAELHEIEGVEVFRPFPDQIDVYLASSPDSQTLTAIAAVFAGREERAIDIEAAGDAALDVRESLIGLGVPATSLSAHRDNGVTGVVLRIRYRI
jgi:hypothetical protein